MIKKSIRAILTITLLYFIYGETGWATMLALLLIAVKAEVLKRIIEDLFEIIKGETRQ